MRNSSTARARSCTAPQSPGSTCPERCCRTPCYLSNRRDKISNTHILAFLNHKFILQRYQDIEEGCQDRALGNDGRTWAASAIGGRHSCFLWCVFFKRTRGSELEDRLEGTRVEDDDGWALEQITWVCDFGTTLAWRVLDSSLVIIRCRSRCIPWLGDFSSKRVINCYRYSGPFRSFLDILWSISSLYSRNLSPWPLLTTVICTHDIFDIGHT